MFGFVGPNGAGKTTTMRIVLGVLAADRGEVLFDGRRSTSTMRARFGYMPEERGLYPKMRVRDQLVYLARLHGVDAGGARPRGRRLDRAARADRPRRRPRRAALAGQPAARAARGGARARSRAAGARRAVLRAGPGRRRRAQRRARRLRRDRRAGGVLLAPARARRAPVRGRGDHQGRSAGGVRAGRGAARPRGRPTATCASRSQADGDGWLAAVPGADAVDAGPRGTLVALRDGASPSRARRRPRGRAGDATSASSARR